MTDYKLQSGIAGKLMAEYDKLLPPCCRGFQDCIHNYMVRIPDAKIEPWRNPVKHD